VRETPREKQVLRNLKEEETLPERIEDGNKRTKLIPKAGPMEAKDLD